MLCVLWDLCSEDEDCFFSTLPTGGRAFVIDSRFFYTKNPEKHRKQIALMWHTSMLILCIYQGHLYLVRDVVVEMSLLYKYTYMDLLSNL